MTREISHTPIPSVEHTSDGEREEVELVCRECDLNLHAEGAHLLSLAIAINGEHGRMHHRREEATP